MSALTYWQWLLIAGAVLLIIEMLTPSMFFLNLALACFVTAGVSVYVPDFSVLVIVWAVASALSLLFLRPLLVRKTSGKGTETGIGRYIGAEARVTEEVSKDKGVIKIFDERWEARSEDGSRIPEGTAVIITKNDNLIMYVRKEK